MPPIAIISKYLMSMNYNTIYQNSEYDFNIL